MDVAIRVEGGSQIGYGHLMRSGALAEELLSREHIVTVATTTPETAQTVFPDNVEIVTLPSRGDPKPFVNWLNKNTPDVVFTDSYPVDTDYQRAIRDQAPLAVLQDDDRHAVCADLFINGNLYATNLEYEFVGNEPRLCLGPDYVLLRREICERASDEPPWREEPERALITMGGSDTSSQTPMVLHAFNRFSLRVDTVIGPGFTDEQESEVRSVADKMSPEVHVIRDPDNLAERMFRADFAVSTASSTVYELLALGTPIVCNPIVDNQTYIGTALQQRDAATVLDRDANRQQFHAAIKQYVTNPALRRTRQNRGRELVDTAGAARVLTELAEICRQ
jgi:UDP-2,4-diacetamido-2,4,6-trideoxy-beta-L-altropyranose hydrolase